MLPIKILFSSMNSSGHVNACIAVAELLAPRGHKIIFALTNAWRPLVDKHNFQFVELVMDAKNEIVDEEDNNNDKKGTNKGHKKNEVNGKIKSISIEVDNHDKENSGDDQKRAGNAFTAEYVSRLMAEYRIKPMDRIEYYDEDWVKMHNQFFEYMGAMDEPLGQLLDEIKPNLVIVDVTIWLPCLMKRKIPWISLWSSNPFYIYPGDRPPFGPSEYPTERFKQEWHKLIEIKSEKYRPIVENKRRWLAERGIEVTEENPKFLLFESPYMNMYNYPEILDYSDVSEKPEKWFRFDSKVRIPDDKTPFTIPENLVDKPGKLIYFSLGSMGGIDLDLMKRVISCLTKSPHRFIVSKGPHHEKIDLPDNMWGDRYVNQIAILPHVDLVISHGGNNTLSESLYFGRPIICLPFFFDQFDNAQRIEEKGLGRRIDTFYFEDHELLEAIEKILNDDKIYSRLSVIQAQLRASTTREELCKLIEKTAILKKSPFE